MDSEDWVVSLLPVDVGVISAEGVDGFEAELDSAVPVTLERADNPELKLELEAPTTLAQSALAAGRTCSLLMSVTHWGLRG